MMNEPSELKLYNSKLRSVIWKKTDGQCWYCGDKTAPWDTFHIDHAYPKSRGGTNKRENLVPACRPCNIRKKNRTVEEYRDLLTTTESPHLFWFEIAESTTNRFPCCTECERMVDADSGIARVISQTPYHNDIAMFTLIAIGYLEGKFLIPSLRAISNFTHQDPHIILTHLFRFMDDGLIEVEWVDQLGETCARILVEEEESTSAVLSDRFLPIWEPYVSKEA